MTRPRLLDLFSGAGGAGMGYHRAGFDVVGVDIAPQPNYPFEFHQADALEYAAAHMHEFDAIHSSPPCQSQTALTKGTNKAMAGKYPNFIPQTRELLAEFSGPTVIENVQGSEIRPDLILCGEMFGLGVIRHRHFELNVQVPKIQHIKHRGRVAGCRHGKWYDGPYFAVYGEGGGKGTVEQWQRAMGIDWTNVRKEIAEAIPPAYSEYIGKHLIEYV
ncbi:DNA methyltransferase [Mycobacterium phage Courthouse]|uniref:DNA methyltransferase n=2 Tax=Omegavirus courthouse TaxID=1089119 RepID=G8I5G9_9CAUD|nr:DNA methylase [Mycobacterium phage Courthouse]YP_009205247.1 DNA methylase [Mycobacterium phage Ariel]AER47963.1 DNA methyltransferase [Mycobacterium phage Courthouse]AIM49994.1 DNA methyltransferase [Mycobacterium phage Ariel]ATS92955.1 DNA methyltransferase [Mycobacterium phage Superphikiman]